MERSERAILLTVSAGDQPPFDADRANQENGLIYAANGADAPGALQSQRMDFRHADNADTKTLNLILWRDAMGDQPPPAMPSLRRTKTRDDDD